MRICRVNAINCSLITTSIYVAIINESQLLASQDVSDDYLDNMMNDAPGPINFTMFLTLFGERLQGTDPEEVIRNAFGCFDEENAGEYLNMFTVPLILKTRSFMRFSIERLKICNVSKVHLAVGTR